jgi:hypothetical protein
VTAGAAIVLVVSVLVLVLVVGAHPDIGGSWHPWGLAGFMTGRVVEPSCLSLRRQTARLRGGVRVRRRRSGGPPGRLRPGCRGPVRLIAR